MVRGALLELAAGAGACCVALGHRRAGSARVALAALLLLAALAVHAELLLSVANSTVAANRAVVSYVEESTKLIRMQVEAGKLDEAGDSAGVLSNDPGEAMDSTSGQIMNLVGEERTNMDDLQPLDEVDHLIMDTATEEEEEEEEEFPTRSTDEEAAPPPASGEAHAPPPAAWRYLSFPSDHVMLLGCSGDEFTVRIMPRLEGLEQQSLREANGDLRPDGCLRPAAGTLSVYNREPHYDAVFWALPGEEKCVPVPVPSRESEAALVVEENPEAFVLSADVVAFYRPIAGRSEVHIRPRNAVGFMPLSNVEEQGKALRALHPHGIIYAD